MEGLITKQEKPSNTEVLGLLMDEDKLKFISNLSDRNIKGLFRANYLINRLKNMKEDPMVILENSLENLLAYKCSLKLGKQANRADQIVDALKHIKDDEKKDDIKSIAQQMKS